MNSSEFHPRKAYPPPPKVSLEQHRRVTGLRRVVALAYVRRLPLAVSSVAVAATIAAVNLPSMSGRLIDDLNSTPSSSVLSLPIEDPTSAEQPDTGEAMVIETAPPISEGSEGAASGVIEGAAAEPPHNEQKALQSPQSKLSREFSSIDLSDLAVAVDELGLRAQRIEEKMPQSVDREPGAAPANSPPAVPVEAAASEDNRLAMTADDAKTLEQLKARVTEFEAKGNGKALDAARAELSMFESTLRTEIEFRIVDREGERAGFWRTPVGDPSNKQFFVVVEPIVDGQVVNWAVRDADSKRIVSRPKFALRVDEKTFSELSDDKKENGRIDNMVVGMKPVGRITPVWNIKTDGEAITGF